MFQLILPFQLELPFDADGALAARPDGSRSAALPAARRARRAPRARKGAANLNFEFVPSGDSMR